MSTQTENALFRFAHISDLHFSCATFNPIQFFSKRWIGNINYLLTRQHAFTPEKLTSLLPTFRELGVNAVLITGDLSSTSQEKEFTLAKEFIDGLKKEQLKVFALPGNHDQYTKCAYRNQLFYDFFDPTFSDTSGLSLKKDKLSASYLGHDWWLIGLDTAIATSLFSSSGYFSSELEALLEKALSEMPKNHKVIMMNHFPLFCNESKRKELVRKEALRKLLERFPQVKLYLNGHTHRHCIADLRSSNLPIILDSGSTAQKKGASWNLIEITDKGCSIEVFKNQSNPTSLPWEPVLKTNFQW